MRGGVPPVVVPVDRLDEATTGWPHAPGGPAPAALAARWDLLVISPGPGTPEEYPQYAPLLGGACSHQRQRTGRQRLGDVLARPQRNA